MHLLLKNRVKIAFAMSIALLTACTTPQISTYIQPELSSNQQASLANGKLLWRISSQDQRIAHYLIEIGSGDDAARLINESRSSRLIIEDALYKQWIKRGLLFDTNSNNKIDIQIIKLLAKVQQNSLTFINNADIVIRVELTMKNKTYSKTFKSHYYEEGLLKADSEKVTGQLNSQLSQLLNEIIQDPELNDKLQNL